MNFIELTHEAIDTSKICDLVAHEKCGAIAIFAGTTRDNFENKKVEAKTLKIVIINFNFR